MLPKPAVRPGARPGAHPGARPCSSARPRRWPALLLLAGAGLAGCAGVSPEAALQAPAQATRQQFHAEAALLLSEAQRQDAHAQALQQLRTGPLQVEAAVRLALLQSPALQAQLAQGWQAQQGARRAALPASPRLLWERLVQGDEREFTRALSLPLLDWLLWPLREGAATAGTQAAQLATAQALLSACYGVKAQWTRAVAAAQSVRYHEQVLASAEASEALAQRMLAAGNFSKLQHAREALARAEARMRLAQAQAAAGAEREALVRALGLDASQAQALQLPAQLPEVPREPPAPAPAQAEPQRLDLALAQARWRHARALAGHAALASLDLDATLRRQSNTGLPTGRGVELDLALPLAAPARQQEANATELAALAQWQALQRETDSLLRERQAALAAAHAMARTAQEELLPLARRITDENQLRYNGMLIGSFELLAEARAQVGTVQQALQAQRDYWLALNALQAAQAGASVAGPDLGPSASAAPTASPTGGH